MVSSYRLSILVLAVASAVSCAAQAGDNYAGIALGTPGEAYADFASAKRVRNFNSPRAVKLYGGTMFDEHYGVEIGYGNFGNWKFADPGAGGAQGLSLASSVVYAAAKGSYALGDAFTVFGKFGVAANRFSWSGAQAPGSVSSVRPMFGVGGEYRVTDGVSAVLEFEHVGPASAPGQQFTQRKLELGLKYKF